MIAWAVRRRLFAISAAGAVERVPAPASESWPERALALLDRPRSGPALVTVMTAGAGVMLGGPVAGLVLGAYGAVGAVSWRAWRARQRADRARQQSIEAIADMAADLRAGLAVPAVARVPDDAATARVAAARQISERLGAPLADLLDRIEIDLRGQRRVRAEVAAQTAGARATIVLLAVMPFGGVFLGTSLGTDPLHQLLHTRPGAGCATVALVLQGCGLLVASRLVRAGATGLDG